jgi:hypothetical protein
VLTLRGRTLHCTALPDGAGGHVVLFNARMRAETGARAGERVAIEVALDRGSREQPFPGDLAAALEADAGARAAFAALPPSLRREIAQWLARAKRPETRVRAPRSRAAPRRRAGRGARGAPGSAAGRRAPQGAMTAVTASVRLVLNGAAKPGSRP